jgi:hypothetical protein
MHKAGVHPALIYAYQQTGRMVTRENQTHVSPEDLQEWNDAIDERYETHEEE